MDLGGQLKSTAIFRKRENSAGSAISTDQFRSPVHFERPKPACPRDQQNLEAKTWRE
jgi:hypothetical protein